MEAEAGFDAGAKAAADATMVSANTDFIIYIYFVDFSVSYLILLKFQRIEHQNKKKKDY